MTEEINNADKAEAQSGTSQADVAVNSQDALKAASALINRTGKEAGARRSELERLTAEGERAKDARLADVQAKMAENTERAKKTAIEQSARMEYGGEYRQRLAARENKRAAEERRLREEAQNEEKRRIDSEREREIAEFLKKEKEEAERRASATTELLASLSDNDGGDETAHEEESAEFSAKEEVPDIKEPDAEEKAPTDTDGEKITLEIKGGKEKRDDGRVLLNIRAADVGFGGSGAPYMHTGVPHAPKTVSDAYAEPRRKAQPASAPYTPYADGNASRYEYCERRDGEAYEPYISDMPEHFENTARGAGVADGEYAAMKENAELDRRFFEEAAVAEYERYEEARRASREAYLNKKAHAAMLGEKELYTVPPTEEYGEYGEAPLPSEEAVSVSEPQNSEKEEIAEYERETEAYRLSDSEYRTDDVGRFARLQLAKQLEKYYKDEALLLRKISRLEKKQKHAATEQNTLIIVEKIGVQKELCELASEALSAAAYAEAKGKTAKHKKILEAHIDAYNALCEEYEKSTGRPLERLSPTMAEDIIAGRICRPIPNVYYNGEDGANGKYDAKLAEAERKRRIAAEAELRDRELERLLYDKPRQAPTQAQKREAARKNSERMSKIKRATERDILLVGLRNEYRISRLEAERDLLLHSFGTDRKNSEKRLAVIEEALKRTKRAAKHAVKLEQEDNSRYYFLAALDPSEEKTRKRAKRDRLAALRMRLDVLLSERERINESLIALYGGTDGRLTRTKIERKAGAVRRKYAKSLYKRQRSIAARIEKFKAPLDMKEKAYDILNRKTAAVARLEESKYKLKRMKPAGSARRELISDIKQAKAQVKHADRDLKFIMKKLQKQHEKYVDERSWGIMLAVIAALLLVGFGAWYLFGDSLGAYFSGLAARFLNGR